MPRCVYCQEEKPEDSFRRAEHVVPQSFGTFRHNFTLRGKVCDLCNQYFGDQLELALARDSFEGHSRYEYGVRNPEEFRPFGRNSRIILRICEGDFSGAYAYREYTEDEANIVLRPLPQVGFLMSPLNKYKYFLLDEIPAGPELRENGFQSRHPEAIRGLAVNEALLWDKLGEKGISFRVGGEVVPPERSHSILCELVGRIDHSIFRAIAKIAFNYLVFWQGSEFVQHPSFDVMRRYIRKGENPNYKMIDVQHAALLGDESVGGRRRLGHLITTNWAQDRVSIVAQVALFNWVRYRVSLSRNFTGERRDIKRGHFFDVRNRQILELRAG